MSDALNRLRAREATVDDLRELLPKLLAGYDAATLRSNHCIRTEEGHGPGGNCVGCAINATIDAIQNADCGQVAKPKYPPDTEYE